MTAKYAKYTKRTAILAAKMHIRHKKRHSIPRPAVTGSPSDGKILGLQGFFNWQLINS
jgi:hypothetical protein